MVRSWDGRIARLTRFALLKHAMPHKYGIAATRAKSPKLRHLQRHREDKLEKRVEVAKMYMVL